MDADELRKAVTRIADLLNHAGIKTAVDQYRSAKGDQRTAAAARLGHAGAILVEKIDAMPFNERKAMKCLHLDSLGSSEYWHKLLSDSSDSRAHQGEVVRLASRVMFASSHLPGLISLMNDVSSGVATPVAPPAVSAVNPLLRPVEEGEGALFIRLTDAGERASDPDRIARAIDGVDMLYSACASIARKPAIDLRLDDVAAKHNRDRDFRFTGAKDSISAVFAVIDSIPGALADIDPDQDIDLDAVVRSLPIFQDLNTLASLGTFSGKDLKDISETMHQGALLILESGVILIDEQMASHGQMDGELRPVPAAVSTSQSAYQAPSDAHNVNSPGSAAEDDEHYNRYLQEREAMMRSQAPGQTSSSAHGFNGERSNASVSGILAQAESGADDQTRRDAVDELLKSLGQSRTS